MAAETSGKHPARPADNGWRATYSKRAGTQCGVVRARRAGKLHYTRTVCGGKCRVYTIVNAQSREPPEHVKNDGEVFCATDK